MGGAGMRLRALASRVRASLRQAVEWALHPLRRRAALTRLRDAPSAASVLFVCYGNICRSPYAAVSFRRALGTAPSPPQVSSAGFYGPMRPSPELAQRAANGRGVDLSSHRSVLLDADQVQRADLIVVMDPGQRRDVERQYGKPRQGIVVLGDLAPVFRGARAIQDPYGKSAAVFDEVYGRIDECLEVLRAAVGNGR